MDTPESSLAGTPDSDVAPLQVLALDGGGLRGIFTAAALAAWEEDFNTSVADHFDLIVGTSTGGIIALALGLDVSPAEVLSIYVDNGDCIFPSARRAIHRRWRRTWRPQCKTNELRAVLRSRRLGIWRPRYRADGLRAVLRKRFGDQTLGSSRVRLAIPSYDLAADHIHLFRTPHHRDLRRDWRVPVVDVALATAAAPIFLPVHRMESQRLIDGGVWANNPALVGATECLDRLGGERGRIRVLSVGTTSDIRKRRAALNNGGFITWALNARDVVLRGQCLAAINHTRLILGQRNVVRVDMSTPAGLHMLDAVKTDDLIARARAASRTQAPKLAFFFEHTPSRYEPLYPKKVAHAR